MPAIQTAPIQTDRRKFLAGTGAAFGALLASGCTTNRMVMAAGTAGVPAYDPL